MRANYIFMYFLYYFSKFFEKNKISNATTAEAIENTKLNDKFGKTEKEEKESNKRKM